MSSITPTLQVDITISGTTTTEISGGCSQSQVGEIQIVGIQGIPGETGPSSTGNISLLSGQIISLSGDLYFTGQNILAKINSLSGDLLASGSYLLNLINSTGNFTGLFYPLNSNPSGYLYDLSNSGFLTTGDTGNFYSKNNPSGFITGFNSGDYVLKSETGQFANKNDLIESGLNLNSKIISLSGDLLNTGANLLNEINLLKLNSGVNIEGKNGIIVTTGLNNIFTISGSGFATTLELFNSGQNLLGKIVSLSGDLILSGQNLHNYIISLSGDLLSSGQNLNNKINIISGNLINSGIDILNRILSLSGDLLNTGSNLLSQINDVKSKTGVHIIAGANITVISGNNNTFTISSTASGSSAVSTGINNFAVNFLINGNGSTITTGYKGFLIIPYDCNLTGWTIIADVTGNIQYEILKNTFSSFTAQTGTVITFGNEKPNLTNQIKNQDSLLTGWITGLAKNDILSVRVDSAATITFATLALLGLK